LKFDEFRQDENEFFRKMSHFYGIAQIARLKPSEQSAAAMRNFRRGDADEWRTVLTPEQMKPFNSGLKPLAERFGWEFGNNGPGEGRYWSAALSLLPAATLLNVLA
jgi:hypothetical protein